MLKLLDLGERVFVLILFGLFCVANIHARELYDIPIVLSELATVVFILARRPTESVSREPSDWLLTFAGTAAAMLARPGGHPLSMTAGFTLLMMGTAIALIAKLSLNRSFGLAPANRGIKSHGAYAFVRHPIYLGYIVIQIGYMLLNPTWWNLLVYACVWPLQVGRLLREERWLLQDPAYQAYANEVRFRLIPLAF